MTQAIQAHLYVLRLRRLFRDAIREARELNLELPYIRGTIAGLLVCMCNVPRSEARLLALAIV